MKNKKLGDVGKQKELYLKKFYENHLKRHGQLTDFSVMTYSKSVLKLFSNIKLSVSVLWWKVHIYRRIGTSRRLLGRARRARKLRCRWRCPVRCRCPRCWPPCRSTGPAWLVSSLQSILFWKGLLGAESRSWCTPLSSASILVQAKSRKIQKHHRRYSNETDKTIAIHANY